MGARAGVGITERVSNWALVWTVARDPLAWLVVGFVGATLGLGLWVLIARRDPRPWVLIAGGYGLGGALGARLDGLVWPDFVVDVAAFATFTWCVWGCAWAFAVVIQPHRHGETRPTRRGRGVLWMAAAAGGVTLATVGTSEIGAFVAVLALPPAIALGALALYETERICAVRAEIAGIFLAGSAILGTMIAANALETIAWTGEIVDGAPASAIAAVAAVAIATRYAVGRLGVGRSAAVPAVFVGVVGLVWILPTLHALRLVRTARAVGVPHVAADVAGWGMPESPWSVIEFASLCWIAPGRTCPPGEALLLHPADRPVGGILARELPPQIPGEDRNERFVAALAPTAPGAWFPERIVWAPVSSGTGVPVVRGGDGRYDVIGWTVDRAELGGVARALTEACWVASVQLVADPAWTADEVLDLCRAGCTFGPREASPPCSWIDGLGFGLHCEAGGRSCYVDPPSAAVCEQGGCDVYLAGGGGVGDVLRVFCPAGGCKIDARGAEVQLDCDGGGCVVRGALRVTWLCAAGGCRVVR